MVNEVWARAARVEIHAQGVSPWMKTAGLGGSSPSSRDVSQGGYAQTGPSSWSYFQDGLPQWMIVAVVLMAFALAGAFGWATRSCAATRRLASFSASTAWPNNPLDPCPARAAPGSQLLSGEGLVRLAGHSEFALRFVSVLGLACWPWHCLTGWADASVLAR